MGLCMVWVGWFGLNAGGAFGATFNTGKTEEENTSHAMLSLPSTLSSSLCLHIVSSSVIVVTLLIIVFPLPLHPSTI